MDKIIIQGLKTKCIIGDYEWERKRPQVLLIDLEMEADLEEACENDALDSGTLDYNMIAKDVLKFVEKSDFHLIETLAQAIANLCLKKSPIESITVRITKPGSIKAAAAAIVEIVRSR
ncbi:MAG: dihydroneopterin aldolase [Deltaproteobacteria bacterium]|nr:dihydroneopterin aldolase [Deltaproteobacteria bacterium]